MPVRNNPPTMPLRLVDERSDFMSKDLLLAYPLLDGGTNMRNYGKWGSVADLNVTGGARSRLNGLSTMSFAGGTASASASGLSLNAPQQWSYAFWLKVNSLPAGISELNIFSMQGSSGASLRAWIDQQGIWSWQKYSIADAYSVLPASDSPTSNLMLITGVYDEPQLPPAQLRTNQGHNTAPLQPESYTVYNPGAGAQATGISSIHIGNNNTSNKPLNGTIGPFYFWGRAISSSEIWQLWQDPYAPFRRSHEQFLVPSTMVATSNHSLRGLGKSDSPKPLIQDNQSLVISVQDYHNYQSKPTDILNGDEVQYGSITVNDSYSYANIPTDTLIADAPFSLITLNVNDSYSYSNLPSDIFIAGDSGSTVVPVITINETINYQNLPTDTSSGSANSPVAITVSDTYDYQDLPDDVVTT
jgi:hypothetical protein